MTVAEARAHMSDTMRKYSSHGAYDSEPIWVMENYLERLLRGKQPTLPTTGEDWQLYTSSMACGKAARALTAALKKLAKAMVREHFKGMI